VWTTSHALVEASTRSKSACDTPPHLCQFVYSISGQVGSAEHWCSEGYHEVKPVKDRDTHSRACICLRSMPCDCPSRWPRAPAPNHAIVTHIPSSPTADEYARQGMGAYHFKGVVQLPEAVAQVLALRRRQAAQSGFACSGIPAAWKMRPMHTTTLPHTGCRGSPAELHGSSFSPLVHHSGEAAHTPPHHLSRTCTSPSTSDSPASQVAFQQPASA
jgi:hypothetical protein